ncbi:polyprenyl synthetase family protein [Yunchengibacter salinarum]|uniref:polyprenyl synthetase family protein n=1 Tax=Yunchengibacter salinarum TaxID=3133399 RepID=UPI0035B5BE17
MNKVQGAHPARPETATSQATQRPVDRMQALVADDLAAVNRAITDRMQSRVGLIPDVGGHLVGAGGKRLRPLLTLVCAAMLGYRQSRHVGLAACVEFIHSATLLHDDVVDMSAKRRGRDTANALWGNQASVLVGDYLFSRAFELMVADGSLRVLEILSQASTVIAEGEVLQLSTARDLTTTEPTYIEVVAAKTAALFAAACEVAGVVAEAGTKTEQALHAYGRNLGIAFQIIDDMLDYDADESALGKAIGDDFDEGKVTLPIILAHARGDGEERAFWQRTIGKGQVEDGDLDHARALFARHGALEDTRKRAESYADAARAALADMPDNAYRTVLLDMVDFCLSRAY